MGRCAVKWGDGDSGEKRVDMDILRAGRSRRSEVVVALRDGERVGGRSTARLGVVPNETLCFYTFAAAAAAGPV